MSSKNLDKTASYEAMEENDEATALKTAEDVNKKAAKLIEAKFASSKNSELINEKQTNSPKVNTVDSENIAGENEEIKKNETFVESDKSFHSPIEPTVEIYELPRDILVAYFLIHLENDGRTNLWNQYNIMGKLGILFAVATPFAIQYFVAVTLVANLDFYASIEKITESGGEAIWYNIITLAILFIYMFRDIHGYTSNVWKFIGRVEEEQKIEYNPLHRSRLKNIGTIFKRWDYHQLDPRQIDLNKQKTRCLFIQFRILILAVFFLYFILTFYSLVQIAFTEELADKLEVSLAIFFLLELDDWSYDLFISQNGILEDNQFDVEFPLEVKENENKFQRDTKAIWCSLWIVFGALTFVMIYSFILNYWDEVSI